jgi:N-methylhydantoinase B
VTEPSLPETSRHEAPITGRLDPIRFEVIRNGLTAIADEMSLALQRAAYSTNIKTRLDFSCAIFDAQTRMIAQAFTQPVHLGTLTHFVPRMIELYGRERLKPGDGIVSNDGHLGGIHLNDVCLMSPLFVEGGEGEPIAFVATIAHHVDVGGGTPGSIGLFQEIFQEGIIIPPTRLLVDGTVDDNVFNLILNNVRAPKETGGDFRAQVAGLNIGLRRLGEMIAKHGLPTFRIATEELLAYTERRVIAELASIPKGTISGEGFLDDDGFTDVPIRIAVKMTAGDDKVTFDLTGSDPQRRCSVNTTYAMAFSACAYTLRALIDPDLPMNDGFYRVLEVIAPLGTVVNSRRPAVSWRSRTPRWFRRCAGLRFSAATTRAT